MTGLSILIVSRMQQGSVEESSSNFLLQVAVENLSKSVKKASSFDILPYL